MGADGTWRAAAERLVRACWRFWVNRTRWLLRWAAEGRGALFLNVRILSLTVSPLKRVSASCDWNSPCAFFCSASSTLSPPFGALFSV